MGYQAIEAEVHDWLKEVFSLDDDFVKAGDFNGLINTLRANMGSYGILTDYEGMSRDTRLGIYWNMRITIWFQYRSETQVEADIRTYVDTFVSAIEGNSKLGGRVTTAVIVQGQPVEVIDRTNELYIGVPFQTRVYERTRG